MIEGETSSFQFGIALGLATAFVQFLIIKIGTYFWKNLSNHRTTFQLGFLSSRKIYVISIIGLLLVALALFMTVYASKLTTAYIILIITITFSFITIVLLMELFVFWGAGFNYIEKSIAKNTYKRAFKTATSEFLLIGTNAYSFVEMDEFRDMLKRVRENHGRVRLLLAHPDSTGLQEAAKNRGCRPELYQNQSKFSLGMIMELKQKLAVNIQIRLYNAKTMEDLPIFRSMFLNSSLCISAIAVYGRDDHGKSSPQIFSRNSQDAEFAHRTIFNVLYRYFRGFWDSSKKPTQNDLKCFEDFKMGVYNGSINRQDLEQ